MRLQSGILGLSLLVFFGCQDNEVSLVRSYKSEWQLDVASKFIENKDLPINRPQTVQFKVVPDGSLVIIFSRRVGETQSEYFITKVNLEGVITKTIDLPAGYFITSIIDGVDGGFVLIMTTDFSKPDFIKIHINGELDTNQESFVFARPTTFHTLTFTENEIYRSEYEGDFPGTRISRFNYQGQLQWSVKHTSEKIRPFPFIGASNLAFFETNYIDSLTFTSLKSSNGSRQWTRSFTSNTLFGVEGKYLSFHFIKGLLYITLHDKESTMTFYSALINPITGMPFRKWKIRTNSISTISMVGPTIDGGLLLRESDLNRTFIFKTDKKGNVGWVGDFLDMGLGNPIECPNGDLYFVTDGYVFKLKAAQ